MKKKLNIVCSFILIGFLMIATGCGDKNTSSDKPKGLSKKVNCIALKSSAGDSVLKNISGNYSVKVYSDFQDAEKRVKNGNFDAVVLPAGMLAKLHKESKHNLVEISPITLDGMYVLANGWAKGSVKTNTLKGLKINAYGEETTPELLVYKNMREQNVATSRLSFEYFYNFDDLKDKMKEYGTFCVASEPYASEIEKIPGVNKVLNLTEKYTEKEGSAAPSEVLAVSKKMLKERPDDVRAIIDDFEKAIENTKINGVQPVFYGRSNRGISILQTFNDGVKKVLPELYTGEKFSSSFYYER